MKEEYLRLREKGLSEMAKGHLDGALTHLKRACEVAEKIDDADLKARARCNLNQAHLMNGETHLAKKGLPEIILANRDPEITQIASWCVSGAFRKERDYQKALFYAKKGLACSVRLRRPSDLFRSLNLIGNTYLCQSKFGKAFSFYKRALKIYRRNIVRKGFIDYYNTCTLINNLGYCHVLMGRTQTGIRVLKNALRLAREHSILRYIAESSQDLSFAFLNADRIPSAIRYGEEAFKVAEENGFDDIARNCCFLLGEAYSRTENQARAKYFYQRLQGFYPGIRFLGEFLKNFDILSIINLKE